MDAFPTLDLAPFSYVSIHAPSAFCTLAESEVIQFLRPALDAKVPIVLHPDASSNLALWREFGKSLLIENMDKRKRTGRTVRELMAIFEQLPEASLCFDIAHARQVDPSMGQASLILRQFQSRLVQVHMSEVDINGRHTKLTRGATFAYPRVLPLIPASVPVILESVLNETEMVAELAFARRLCAERGPMFGKLAL
jgi:hypothetical protein